MITIEGVDPRMIANNLTPYRPVHPGELLKDEFKKEYPPKIWVAAFIVVYLHPIRKGLLG